MATVVASDEFMEVVSHPPSRFTRTWRRIAIAPIWLVFHLYTFVALAMYFVLWLFVDHRGSKPMPSRRKPTTDDSKRVVIIGAGWAGVTAAKHFVQEGFKVTVLEKRDGIGGIWRYTDSKEVVSCMSTTRTTSSSQVSEFNDFPMSEEMGDFPTHEQMLDYLERYREHFIGDADNCEFVFDCQVKNVEKVDGEWVVDSSTGQYRADFVTVATGTHERPRMGAQDTVFGNFSGNITHSCAIKTIDDSSPFKNKRVLVFGGGETASDLVHHLVGVASKISWSIPTGGIFQAVYAGTQPADALAALFVMAYSVVGAIYPPKELVWFDALDCGNFNGHGIEEFRTNCLLDCTFYNKASESLQYIYSGMVKARRKIRSCKGHTVEWEDGTKEDFDEVILCTGYEHSLSFLPEEYHGNGITDWYRYIFSTHDPSLMFIGFARPILLSLFTVVEAQSRLAAEVMAGRVKLPDNLPERAAHDKDVHDRYFAARSNRLQLVHHNHYLMKLAVDAGTAPKFWKLLFTNPVKWVVSHIGPYSGYLARTNDSSTMDMVRFYARHYTMQSVLGASTLMLGSFLQLHRFQGYILNPSRGGVFKRDAFKFRLKPKLHLADKYLGNTAKGTKTNGAATEREFREDGHKHAD